MTRLGFCTRCGADRREGARFCAACGFDFEGGPASSATAGATAASAASTVGASADTPITPAQTYTVPRATLPTPPRSTFGRGGAGAAGGSNRFSSSSSSSRAKGCLLRLGLGLLALAALGWAVELMGGGAERTAPPQSLESITVDASFPGASGIAEPTALPIEPGSAGADAIPTEPPLARAVELRKAIAAKEIAVTGRGMNLEQLSLKLTSKASEPIRVVINAGTILRPGASGTQSMVVIQKEVILLQPGADQTQTLDVACADMERDTPTAADSFRVEAKATPSDLVKLLALPAFAEQEFRIKQFAVWTITDNPTRSGYVGLGYFGTGSGPDAKEIATIRSLMKSAKIDTTRYQALR